MVIKSEILLLEGLKNSEYQNKIDNLDVVDENSCQELISALDLESAVITPEATILSAIERKKQRRSPKK